MNVKLLVIIWPDGYIITNDVTFSHMGNALVFYFEGWSYFQTFKNKPPEARGLLLYCVVLIGEPGRLVCQAFTSSASHRGVRPSRCATGWGVRPLAQ